MNNVASYTCPLATNHRLSARLCLATSQHVKDRNLAPPPPPEVMEEMATAAVPQRRDEREESSAAISVKID